MARVRRPSGRGRYRLRFRIFLAVVLGALLPLTLVSLWSQIERPVPSTMRQATISAVLEVREAIEGASSLDSAKKTIDAIAIGRGARIRILDSSGKTLFETAHDTSEYGFHPVERFFFGAVSPEEAARLDAARGAVIDRQEVRAILGREVQPAKPVGTAFSHPSSALPANELGLVPVTRDGVAAECQLDELVACGAAGETIFGGARVVLHAEKTSLRAVAAVYALRGHLLRIAFVTVPLALLLAAYLSRRLMGPIETLRHEALEKAGSQNAKPDLPEGDDEVGELSQAFNRLLLSLREERTAHSAALSDLVHELKSPIAAVRSASELLVSQGEADARALRLSNILLESSKKMDAVVSQYLDLARVEAGLPDEARTRLTARSLLQNESLTAGLSAKVDVVIDASADEVVFEAVETRISKALRELLENADSFTHIGGSIGLYARVEADRLALAVSDQGPGIPEESLGRVFDRFFTTRGDKRGTGLGLAMVRATALAHGGDVKVSSSAGRGTTFTVYFPTTRS